MPTPHRPPLVSSVLARLARWRTPQDLAPEDSYRSDPTAVSQQQRMEVIGRLASRYCHDFNNQLGVISNSAYLIGRRARDPLLAESAQATLRAVEVASGLTQRLQRLGARHAGGAQPLELEPWLQPLLPALAMVLGKRMKLELRPVPADLQIHVAADELELALTSLLLWVREVLPDGGSVAIEARHLPAQALQLPAGAYVQLAIEAGVQGARCPAEPVRAGAQACEPWGLGLAHSLGNAAGGGLWVVAEQGRSLCARLVLAQVLGR